MENAPSQPLVSVIIPVYNAAETITRTMESLYAQQYDQLQIILVNDGSRDDSEAVCRSLMENDRRIELYTQKNMGCAAARNTALSHARGDLYCFMDADDTMEMGALKKMVDAIGDTDIVIAHYYFVLGKVATEHGLIDEDAVFDENRFLNALVKQPGAFYYSALWNKLYRGDIIRENASLMFDSRLTWGEDFAFNMRYYAFVHSARMLPQPVYSYYKAPGGISVRALLHIAYSCRIKWILYLYFKALCIKKGIWEEKKARIRLYIFNITLSD